VFIFVTIAKFGALTCSIIGLARKVTTLVASIYFYGHHLNSLQFTGLMISVTAMVLNFLGKKGGGGGHGPPPKTTNMPEEMQKMLDDDPQDDDDNDDDDSGGDGGGDVELAASPKELV
jgi:UDP-galactose transporter B1